MERFEQRGDGSKLKEVGGKWRRKFWTRTAKRRLTEAGAPFLEWRRVRRSGKYRVRKWEEDCWARIFALFKEYNLQRRQSMHEDSTEESENEEAAMNEGHMKEMTKKIRSKVRMDAENRWCVGDLLAANCEKAWIYRGEEGTMQKWYVWLEKLKKGR